jgi:hypothetical protein
MIDVEKLMDEIEKDLEFDRDKLDEVMYKIPNLHSKYLRYLYQESNELSKREIQLKKKYRKMWYYYKNDYDYVVEDKHIPWHIETDDDYAKMLYSVNKLKNNVNVIEKAIREIGKLSFTIKNIIDWERFKVGS